MPQLAPCPSPESWLTLLDLDASPSQRERLERHLEDCPACQERLDRTGEGPDPLLQIARDVGDPTATRADPTLTRFLDRLHQGRDPEQAQESGQTDLGFLTPGDRPDLLGTLGDYEVLEVIGQGGMGVVLKAFEPALQRLVAIKVLAPELADSATARRRFTREARAAAAVRHEHIVAVHGVHEAGGLPYLVMEYVAGESLQERLDRAGPLPVPEVIPIAVQAASALAAAHAQGLIHRDVKPANILIADCGLRMADCKAILPGEGVSAPLSESAIRNPQSAIKITDFGLARLIDDVGVTQPGVVAGTPEYMAPEQARAEPVDHRADLFSLGSVLYALLTGVGPFRGTTALGVLRKVCEETPVPVRSLNRDVPAWLERLINRLLAKDPAARCQSASEVLAVLESRGQGEVRDPGRRALRRGLLAGVSACLVIGLVLFAQPAANAPADRGEPVSYYQDFRGRPLPADMTWFNAEGGAIIRHEPEGLRITIPKTWTHPWGGVGVRTIFGFGGDFEVTTSFELLQTETPPAGYGVGVCLYLARPDEGGGASLCRLVRAREKQILWWDHTSYVAGNPKPVIQEGGFPCTDRTVRLRLKRTGMVLHYLWAPGAEGEDFAEIHQCEFGDGPIDRVRLAALTGRQSCDLDLRLFDLRIQSQVPDPITVTPQKSGWKVGLALTLAAAVALGLGFASLRGRRARAADTPGRKEAGRPAAGKA